jgi:LysM repeat protein
MRRFVAVSGLALLCSLRLACAQDSTPPPAPADSSSPAPAAPSADAPVPVHTVSSEELLENYNVLSGKFQDLQDANEDLKKRIADLEKEISDLRDQISKPAGNFVSQDDFKKALDDIDKAREADKEVTLKALKDALHGKGTVSVPTHGHPTDNTPVSSSKGDTGDESFFTYEIKPGNTLLLIEQAYRAQGVKVTLNQILDANPGLNPNKLVIGQKIRIPAPKDAPKPN